jgi:2-iminobutanoate/2-iminopropanoate deaminase
MAARHPVRYLDAEWGNPRSYSQAVRIGDMIFTAGQLGAEPGGDPVDFSTQTETALRRLITVVENAGGSLATILKVNCYLRSIDDFEEFDAIYRRTIPLEPKPARTTVQIGGFIGPLLIEIDAVACAVRA